MNGVLGGPSTLGATAKSYPWHVFSQDTLELQLATNQELKAAGYCPVPASGVLDGSLCGARNHLTIRSRELFGKDMLFANPEPCKDPANADELTVPTPGCFKPSPLRENQVIGGGVLTKRDWLLLGGAASAILAAYLVIKQSPPARRSATA